MSKARRKLDPAATLRASEQAARSKAAMQRASSVRKSVAPLLEVEASAKGRKGLKGVVVYLSPDAKEQLARIAYDQRKSMQTLGVEAFNLLFEANRLKPIA